MYNLRTYQATAKAEVYRKIAEGKRRILVWMPTGSGKGLQMSDFVQDCVGNGRMALAVMRRRDLIFQTQKNFKKYHGIDSGIIMGNSKGEDHKALCQVCSIDTIRTRMMMSSYDYLLGARLVEIDEAHDTNSPTYQRFFHWLDTGELIKDRAVLRRSDMTGRPEKIFIGFTATPFTIGGKPLDFWEDFVQPISPEEMRDQGFLVDTLHYAPKAKINTVGIKIEDGDFKERDLFERASESVLVGDIVSTWVELGEMRPTIMYCVNKEHSKLMTAAFNYRGIPAVHIDESSTAEERLAACLGLRDGKFKVMCNIETMTTGVDAPWVSCISWARPTWSEVLYCQGNGRGLRPYKVCADCGMEYGGEKACIRCKSELCTFEKRDCIILDHAANAERHGFAFDDRRAMLKKLMGEAELKNFGKGVRRVENPVTQCMTCFVYVKPGNPCPRCNEIKKSVELPKTEDGKLELIDDETMKKLKLNQILELYRILRIREDKLRWPPGKKWFALYDKFGDTLFLFKDQLGVPPWLEKKVWERKQKEYYANNQGQ